MFIRLTNIESTNFFLSRSLRNFIFKLKIVCLHDFHVVFRILVRPMLYLSTLYIADVLTQHSFEVVLIDSLTLKKDLLENGDLGFLNLIN